MAADVAHRDLVVYGATAGGDVAAVAAARGGMRVTLLAADRHVGGMVTGCLGKTDMERQEAVIGGLARAFHDEVGAQLGHAAGIAAAQCVRLGVAPHDVDVPGLQATLVAQRQVVGV